jgi:hypothetical protein
VHVGRHKIYVRTDVDDVGNGDGDDDDDDGDGDGDDGGGNDSRSVRPPVQ